MTNNAHSVVKNLLYVQISNVITTRITSGVTVDSHQHPHYIPVARLYNVTITTETWKDILQRYITMQKQGTEIIHQFFFLGSCDHAS